MMRMWVSLSLCIMMLVGLPLSSEAAVPAFDSTRPGKLKGRAKIQQHLFDRLFELEAHPRESEEVPGTDSYFSFPASLLGHTQFDILFGENRRLSSMAESIFFYDTPIAFNVLLHYTAFSELATQLAAFCGAAENENEESVTNRLKISFVDRLEKVCAWPNVNESDLKAFWRQVIGSRATDENDGEGNEFHAWQQFFSTPEQKQRPASAVVRDMLLAIFMNPYFLLDNFTGN